MATFDSIFLINIIFHNNKKNHPVLSFDLNHGSDNDLDDSRSHGSNSGLGASSELCSFPNADPGNEVNDLHSDQSSKPISDQNDVKEDSYVPFNVDQSPIAVHLSLYKLNVSPHSTMSTNSKHVEKRQRIRKQRKKNVEPQASANLIKDYYFLITTCQHIIRHYLPMQLKNSLNNDVVLLAIQVILIIMMMLVLNQKHHQSFVMEIRGLKSKHRKTFRPHT